MAVTNPGLPGDIWRQFIADLNRRVDVEPWLSDPSVVAEMSRALLRGEPPDLRQTDWWRSLSEDQRAWVAMQAGDPATAAAQQDVARDQVRQEVLRWLGPQYGSWSEEEIDEWADYVRSSGEQGLVHLRRELAGLRVAAFPNWTNESTTYADISRVTQGLFQREWGMTMDEDDRFFQKIASMSDHDHALEMMRQEGIERGVNAVVEDAYGGLFRQTGSGIRRAV